MKATVAKILFVLPFFTITGCTSFMGNSDYGCNSVPGEPRCISARDSYLQDVGSSSGSATASTPTSGGTATTTSEEPEEVHVRRTIDTMVVPKMPNKPQPIRSAAKVMRILIAPYEDNNGDLIVSSHVYSEIETRKWLYENTAMPEYQGIKPLQMLQPIDKEKKDEKNESKFDASQQTVNQIVEGAKSFMNKK